MADKRLFQEIIPNITELYHELPDDNIIALLGFDISLELHQLYRALEKDRIPYISMFPGPDIFNQIPFKEVHRMHLNKLAEVVFDEEHIGF